MKEPPFENCVLLVTALKLFQVLLNHLVAEHVASKHHSVPFVTTKQMRIYYIEPSSSPRLLIFPQASLGHGNLDSGSIIWCEDSSASGKENHKELPLRKQTGMGPFIGGFESDVDEQVFFRLYKTSNDNNTTTKLDRK